MSQSRLPVVVRDAEPEDAAALIDLWGQCVRAADGDGVDGVSPGTVWREPVVAEAAAAIGDSEADPRRRLLVALVDGDVIAVVAVGLRPLTPIHTTKTMVVSDLHVAPTYRRKCVASTLMSAAVRWAEESDCEVVLTSAPAVSRDAHRFLARLGFGHVATVRAAQVSALRSRFAGMATSSKDTGRLIAVRRTLRRRHSGARKLSPGA
ncbi:MAG: GNAT family N-acetyltransferase [Nocardioidaceae bacterium]